MGNVYRPNTDYSLAAQVVGDNGKVAFIQSVQTVDATGAPVGASAYLPASNDRSGTATTTSGGHSVAANATRRFLVGQNVSGVVIGFNEQGGTAVIGAAGTYTVPAGTSFSISTNKLVNFIAASGTAAITMTEG